MPEATKYQPGMFCWVELSTRGANDAKKFYKEILGWSYDDIPIPGGGVYTMCKLRNREVCALTEQREDQRKQGVPPNWLPYVAVANVDASSKRVTELGGKVHAPPFDVMDVGRMAVIADPAHAIFALWQPAKHQGAGLVREVGAVDWNELSTSDPAAAQRFYTGLFGWKASASKVPGMEYTEYSLADQMVAGMMKGQPGMPPAWTTYFSVADADATAEKTARLGGKVLTPPADIPGVGRFAVLQDPQGAVFGIIHSAMKK